MDRFRVIRELDAPGGAPEGLAWDGWSLLVTNERRDVFRIADPFRAAAFP